MHQWIRHKRSWSVLLTTVYSALAISSVSSGLRVSHMAWRSRFLLENRASSSWIRGLYNGFSIFLSSRTESARSLLVKYPSLNVLGMNSEELRINRFCTSLNRGRRRLLLLSSFTTCMGGLLEASPFNVLATFGFECDRVMALELPSSSCRYGQFAWLWN